MMVGGRWPVVGGGVQNVEHGQINEVRMDATVGGGGGGGQTMIV